MDKYTKINAICYNDCLNLGNLIINKAKKLNAAVAIRIYVDNFMVFQYFMDGRDSGNISWLEGKRKTVLKTGYSSAYAMDSLKRNHEYDWLKKDSDLKIYGGAYPLYVDDNIVAIICVSGMDDSLDDHQLIVDTVNEYFK